MRSGVRKRVDLCRCTGNLSTLAPVVDNSNFQFVKLDIRDRKSAN